MEERLNIIGMAATLNLVNPGKGDELLNIYDRLMIGNTEGLKAFAIEVGRKLAEDMEKECGDVYQGSEGRKNFEFNGEKYEVWIHAIWRPHSHFDYEISKAGESHRRFYTGNAPIPAYIQN